MFLIFDQQAIIIANIPYARHSDRYEKYKIHMILALRAFSVQRGRLSEINKSVQIMISGIKEIN